MLKLFFFSVWPSNISYCSEYIGKGFARRKNSGVKKGLASLDYAS